VAGAIDATHNVSNRARLAGAMHGDRIYWSLTVPALACELKEHDEAMSLYGYTTGRDLSRFGAFLFMGLIGIIIAGLVNIFVGSSALQFEISVIGVIVFTGLTAYVGL
jgi:hypothetical protein